MFDDDHPTSTSKQQWELEKKILEFYSGMTDLTPDNIGAQLKLYRAAHVSYLAGCLGQLLPGFASLDASRPWLVYWIVHSLSLLGASLPEAPPPAAVVRFLACCQSPSGGYGGGPMQLPHLAPTYAAVAALLTIGGPAALDSVDREAMRGFLRRMCLPLSRGGGFAIHEGGEADLRACYTAMAVAHMLCLDKAELAERASLVQYVQRCQTYEGGLGGEPGNEAHGGYTYCGLAALMLAGRHDALDLPRLAQWATARQSYAEGGFNGRTNKLVDGCYSFWQGGIFPLLQLMGPHMLHRVALRQPVNTASAAGSHSHDDAAAATAGCHSHDDAAAATAGAAAQPQPQAGSAATGHVPASEHGASVARGHVPAPGASRLIPRLPPNMPIALTPADVAEGDLAVKQVWSDKVVAEARCHSEAADSALRGGSVRRSRGQTDEARDALDKANAAYEILERASLTSELTWCAAGYKLPCHVTHDAPVAFAGDVGYTPDTDDADDDGAAERAHPVIPELPLMYNHQALQLWLLKCCQATRGGFRDKPGKPVDSYHTCYCLSGLSASQHGSGYVMGPRDNVLERADPLCNVVVTKMIAAQEHYAAAPLP